MTWERRPRWMVEGSAHHRRHLHREEPRTYYTPWHESIDAELQAADGGLGLIVTPQSHRPRLIDVAACRTWIADNGCYTLGERFDEADYLDWLRSFSPAARERCAFATAPDVVGDWAATWERSRPMLERIRAAGFPAAIVLQDGATQDVLSHWREFDAIFVGGSTEWKLSDVAAGIVTRARRIGYLRAHMGRVNGLGRMERACEIGCHSVDGTMLTFGADRNRPAIARMVALANERHGTAWVSKLGNAHSSAAPAPPEQLTLEAVA